MVADVERPDVGPGSVSVFMAMASGISNASGISIVVVVSVDTFEDAPGDANKELMRIVAGEISLSWVSSTMALSGELLGNEADDERLEDDDGGGGNGFGKDEDADETAMSLSKVA